MSFRAIKIVTCGLAFLFLAAGLPSAPSTITVNFHAGPGGPALIDAAGALLAAGAEVRAGWLEPGFDVGQEGWNPALLAGAFREFGRTTVREVFGEPGRFAASVSGDGSSHAGRPIALWIVLSAGTELAGPYSNVTAHAVVSSSSSHWVFPDPSLLPPGNMATLALGEGDEVLFGLAAPSGISGLQLEETGRTYASWREEVFADGSPDTGSEDDHDRDGVTNLIEFFAGTDPVVPTRPPVELAVEHDGGQSWLVLELQRSPWIRGVDAGIESSTDLVTWAPVAEEWLAGDGVASLSQKGRVPAPDTGAGERRYIRAVVRTAP